MRELVPAKKKQFGNQQEGLLESQKGSWKESHVEMSEERRNRRRGLALKDQDLGLHGKIREEGILGQFGSDGNLSLFLNCS